MLGNGTPAVVPDNPVTVNPAVPDQAIVNAIPNASDVVDKSGGGGNVPVVNPANPVLGNGTSGDVPVSANSAVPKQDIPNITPKASDVADNSGSGDRKPVIVNVPGDAVVGNSSPRES